MALASWERRALPGGDAGRTRRSPSGANRSERKPFPLDEGGELLTGLGVAGVIFRRERWYQRILHNETALALQKRLKWDGHTMVIIPVRIT